MSDRELSETEARVLEVLANREGYVLPFASIARQAGLDRGQVRAACHGLRDLGLAGYRTGAEVGGGYQGAGYSILDAGLKRRAGAPGGGR